MIEWRGCYDDGWHGLITEESFSHPAKMARGLLVRIFDELFARGLLTRGDLVVDPFGGIGSTGLEAAGRGCQFIGCELEPKFVGLAVMNFLRHQAMWDAMGYPRPRMVMGDSRRLREHIGPALAEVVVSSPPYACETVNDRNGIDMSLTRIGSRPGGPRSQAQAADGYGTTPGQLGAMKPGQVQAVISSPPYSGIASGAGGLNTQPPKHEGQQGGRSAESASQDTDQRYGESAGQLARMPEGQVQAVVSSPPYEASVNSASHGIDWTKAGPATGNRRHGEGCQHEVTLRAQLSYGQTDGQLGQEQGDTFWSAAAAIVRECHAILKPGGTAVWVVKSFVRNKRLVDFPGDWRRLCEAAGFVLLEEVHALLVEEVRHGHLWEGESVQRTERKSFFRRLAEKKGSPRIDWETVLFMRKAGEDVGSAKCVVSSPPYATEQLGGGGSKHDKVIDAMKAGYGTTPGQLGAMKPGPAPE